MPGGEYVTFPGGMIPKYLFEEARYSFVYGQYLGTIVLGMAYVEHTLAALFYAAGRSDLERANVSKLFREAVRLGWLTKTEFDGLDHARAVRNSVTHFREPLKDGTIEFRSVDQNELPYSILERDARHVLRAAFGLLAKQMV